LVAIFQADLEMMKNSNKQ